MSPLEKYAIDNLSAVITLISGSNINFELVELSIYEKAIIYEYSNEGFKLINQQLRKSKGINSSKFGKHLEKCLKKLPNYDGLVYRAALLTEDEIKRYSDAFINNLVLKEYSFISSSKSRLIAMSFLGNVLFRIYSKSGKDIEKISKFGVHGTPNEKEVLFKTNRNFKVLDVKVEKDFTLITMDEI